MNCLSLLKEKWDKFCNLYSEIRKANNNKIKCLFLDCFVCYKSLGTVIRANCIMCCNKHQKEEFKYYFKGNKYKIKINKHLQPASKLIEAFDGNNKDITDIIKIYAGPFEDFHNMSLTPRMLQFDKIIIRTLNEELFEIKETVYENDQVIYIN